jgi:hypothetical protein
VLKTAHVSFEEIQKMKRFARYWDILYNSGNFTHSVRMLWPDGDVFGGFGTFSDWVYAQTAATWKIAQERMAKLLFTYLTEQKGIDKTAAGRAMASDLSKMKNKRLPAFLRGYAPKPEPETEEPLSASAAMKRQQKRL